MSISELAQALPKKADRLTPSHQRAYGASALVKGKFTFKDKVRDCTFGPKSSHSEQNKEARDTIYMAMLPDYNEKNTLLAMKHAGIQTKGLEGGQASKKFKAISTRQIKEMRKEADRLTAIDERVATSNKRLQADYARAEAKYGPTNFEKAKLRAGAGALKPPSLQQLRKIEKEAGALLRTDPKARIDQYLEDDKDKGSPINHSPDGAQRPDADRDAIVSQIRTAIAKEERSRSKALDLDECKAIASTVASEHDTAHPKSLDVLVKALRSTQPRGSSPQRFLSLDPKGFTAAAANVKTELAGEDYKTRGRFADTFRLLNQAGIALKEHEAALKEAAETAPGEAPATTADKPRKMAPGQAERLATTLAGIFSALEEAHLRGADADVKDEPTFRAAPQTPYGKFLWEEYLATAVIDCANALAATDEGGKNWPSRVMASFVPVSDRRFFTVAEAKPNVRSPVSELFQPEAEGKHDALPADPSGPKVSDDPLESENEPEAAQSQPVNPGVLAQPAPPTISEAPSVHPDFQQAISKAHEVATEWDNQKASGFASYAHNRLLIQSLKTADETLSSLASNTSADQKLKSEAQDRVRRARTEAQSAMPIAPLPKGVAANAAVQLSLADARRLLLSQVTKPGGARLTNDVYIDVSKIYHNKIKDNATFNAGELTKPALEALFLTAHQEHRSKEIDRIVSEQSSGFQNTIKVAQRLSALLATPSAREGLHKQASDSTLQMLDKTIQVLSTLPPATTAEAGQLHEQFSAELKELRSTFSTEAAEKRAEAAALSKAS